MAENFAESTTYALGMIQGFRALFHKMLTAINTEPVSERGKLREVLNDLLGIVNDFPTINERGRFFIEVENGGIAFHWLQDERNKVVQYFIGENVNPE